MSEPRLIEQPGQAPAELRNLDAAISHWPLASARTTLREQQIILSGKLPFDDALEFVQSVPPSRCPGAIGELQIDQSDDPVALRAHLFDQIDPVCFALGFEKRHHCRLSVSWFAVEWPLGLLNIVSTLPSEPRDFKPVVLRYHKTMSELTSELTADLIMHAANVAAGSHRAPCLSAAQWAALRFFARANAMSRTPSAFASFHGTTRGTASQTVKSLVERGYLQRQRSADDGRRKELRITIEGERVLAEDPAEALVRAIDTLPVEQRQALEDVMRRITAQVDTHCGEPTFGICADCGHRDDCEGTNGVCRVTGEQLKRGDAQQLCYAFTPDTTLTTARSLKPLD